MAGNVKFWVNERVCQGMKLTWKGIKTMLTGRDHNYVSFEELCLILCTVQVFKGYA